MMSYIKEVVNSIFIRVQKYITNPIVNVAPLPVSPREPAYRLHFFARSARRPRRETGTRQQAISTRAVRRERTKMEGDPDRMGESADEAERNLWRWGKPTAT